jgi:hypothetical protein
MPDCSPTAWCEVVGPRTNDRSRPSPATERDVGLGVPAVDREDRGRHSVSSNGMPTVGSSSWSTVHERRAGGREAGCRLRTALAVGSGHEWSSTTAPSPRTTGVIDDDLGEPLDGLAGLPVVAGHVPADVAVAEVTRRESSPGSRAPRPNGARIHGRGSTPT